MTKRILRIAGWVILWLLFFWGFILAGFPREDAAKWLTHKLEKGLNAKVSIDKLSITWDFGIKLKGISIYSSQGDAAPEGGYGFKLRLDSLKFSPKLFSLARLRPEGKLWGAPPSGGGFSGSYNKGVLDISFKDIPFSDLSVTGILVPTSATATGSINLKTTGGRGRVEIEVSGLPGGRQRFNLSMPGVEGIVKVAVSLPKM